MLEARMKKLKIVVEHHEEGYVAYPVGMDGVVVGEGDTLEEAVDDVRSAIQFHIETFGEQTVANLPEEVILTDVNVAG